MKKHVSLKHSCLQSRCSDHCSLIFIDLSSLLLPPNPEETPRSFVTLGSYILQLQAPSNIFFMHDCGFSRMISFKAIFILHLKNVVLAFGSPKTDVVSLDPPIRSTMIKFSMWKSCHTHAK